MTSFCNQSARVLERVERSPTSQNKDAHSILNWVLFCYPCHRSCQQIINMGFPFQLPLDKHLRVLLAMVGFHSLLLPALCQLLSVSTACGISQAARWLRRTRSMKPRVLLKLSLSDSVTAIRMNASWESANYEDFILFSNAIRGSDRCGC